MTMKKELTKWAVFVFAALFSFSGSSENLRAQAVNGTLLGTVTDSGGAVVAGANVSITEVNTSLKRSTSNNDSGHYVFGNLDRGVYRVEVQHAGFKKAVFDKIDVLVNKDPRVATHVAT